MHGVFEINCKDKIRVTLIHFRNTESPVSLVAQLLFVVLEAAFHTLCSSSISAHSAVVTNAIFAPNPLLIIKPQFQYVDMDDKENTEAGQGEVLVSADYSGLIKIFINKFKPGCN